MIGPKAYIHSLRMKKNISQIKKRILDKNLMVVVKADAYGHGLLNVVNILASDKDLIFCTFSIEEALEIRKNGVANRIFVFSKLQESWLNLALENNIWINASHFEDLEVLADFFQNT